MRKNKRDRSVLSYTLAHIDRIRAAAENVSLPEQDIIWKERVGANDGCKSAVKDLIRQGCEIIIANSAIYEEAIKSEAEKNPEVDFVVINDSKTQSTVTEDGTELTNLYNVHMDTYEASYVAGVTAGMKVAKLKDMWRQRQTMLHMQILMPITWE